VEAHSDIVVAVGNGLRSPGHFPRRSSFGFHGDLSHGGISGNDCFVLFCFRVVCPSCRNKIFSGGMKNTERVRHVKTMTTNFPLRANHLCIDSRILRFRLSFPLSSTMLSLMTVTGDDSGINDSLDVESDRFIIFLDYLWLYATKKDTTNSYGLLEDADCYSKTQMPMQWRTIGVLPHCKYQRLQ